MASLQKKGNNWFCQFLYRKKRYTFSIGGVDEAEAQAIQAKTDYILMRIKQGLLDPQSCDIVTFIRHDGKPPAVAAEAQKEPDKSLTLGELRDDYIRAFGAGAIEANTLATFRVHMKHLITTFKEGFELEGLTIKHLEEHVNERSKAVQPVTIKKEIDTLRAAWNWAKQRGDIKRVFPSGKLTYSKRKEKLPFMPFEEVQRRIEAGGDREALRECVYLSTQQMDELIQHVKTAKVPDWVYPMIFTACHTGARRSELLRARAEDVDFVAGVMTIREKKRVRGTITTRRVPMSRPLESLLREWIASRPGKALLFGKGDKEVCVQTAQEIFRAAVVDSPWDILKGFHVLRHSFVSACAVKGLDQRFIQEWVGHMDEKTSKRYRHLHPNSQRDALNSLFGSATSPPSHNGATPHG